ncbi:MAG: hexameric tyrosine-coordinated heme protein [Thalassotalea sp.]|nr:hexameric tyrosine-coordinated heme protein [Thalassotalea sp.]MDG2394054.1 hexameric tyrosine-coordinated heme protein [Thalassotalea sp.]
MEDKWLNSLITKDAQDGYELAIKLSRMAIKFTQPSEEIRNKIRPEYASNAQNLIASSQVVATNFNTVALANNFWKD